MFGSKTFSSNLTQLIIHGTNNNWKQLTSLLIQYTANTSWILVPLVNSTVIQTQRPTGKNVCCHGTRPDTNKKTRPNHRILLYALRPTCKVEKLKENLTLLPGIYNLLCRWHVWWAPEGVRKEYTSNSSGWSCLMCLKQNMNSTKNWFWKKFVTKIHLRWMKHTQYYMKTIFSWNS